MTWLTPEQHRDLVNTIRRVLKPARSRAQELIALVDAARRQTLELDEVFSLEPANKELLKLDEGNNWIQFRNGITARIDQATNGIGKKHVHIIGRKGEEIGVVNFDGTGSHGTRVKLQRKLADDLRRIGVQVRPDRMVEWIVVDRPTRELLFG